MSYTPRLTDDGMSDSPYWYSMNPFYIYGYGLPNCTCYAWGRFFEISDVTHEYDPLRQPTLSLGDAGQWWGYTQDGYQRGQYPELGAVICFSKPGAAGHVAIVEEIYENGDILTSNSAVRSTYFYTRVYYKSNGYNFGSYRFQGFIYNPYVDPSPTPPTPTPSWQPSERKFPWFIYSRRWRRFGR